MRSEGGRPSNADDPSMSFGSSSDVNCRTSSSSDWTGSSLALSLAPNQDPIHGGSSKPHTSNDSCWDGIRRTRSESGAPLAFNDFSFVKRLGSGDIGSVYLAELKETGCFFAAKVMDKKELVNRNKAGRARTEREILEMLDHPFLPTLYGCLDSGRWSCLLTEFCPGGDLHVLRQMQPGKRFEEAAVRFYASEVVVALEYVHMLGIVYRDLKPENVLVRSDGHIMLTDFDLSLKCDTPTTPSLLSDQIPAIAVPSTHNPVERPPFAATSCILPNCVVPSMSCFRPKLNRKKKPSRRTGPEIVAEPVDVRSMSFVGTHEYLAPEIVSGEGHGSAVDWWTLGIFIYELLYGMTPFKGCDNESTLANVVARALEFPKDHTVSTQARDLIAALLVKDAVKRMGSTTGATAIKHHPFFKDVNWALLRCTTPPHVPAAFTVVADDECPGSPVEYY